MIFKTEGWVKFRTVPCKDGTVDVWIGDIADNPNNETQSKIALNGFTTYVRLYDEWIRVYGNVPSSEYEKYTKEELKNMLT